MAVHACKDTRRHLTLLFTQPQGGRSQINGNCTQLRVFITLHISHIQRKTRILFSVEASLYMLQKINTYFFFFPVVLHCRPFVHQNVIPGIYSTFYKQT